MTDESTEDDDCPSPDYVGGTSTRGYVGIGVYRSKFEVNLGTLIRSAHAMGGSFVFTVGRRYAGQPSAVGQDQHIPVLGFDSVDDLSSSMPTDSQLVCVDVSPSARPLHSFVHPEQAVYLLGAEDHGLPADILEAHPVVEVPSEWPLNVATAGSIVLYDRLVKRVGRMDRESVLPEWWID